ncbi:MAG: dienelactone hydrolase family protein [Actinocrinis sp.]
MCYDHDSIPPSYRAPITTTTSTSLLLTASDGNVFAAYQSLPAQRSGPGVLVLPDNRGLFGFYEHQTRLLAEQGMPALAIDYYGRSAGPDSRERPKEFAVLANLWPHLKALTSDGLYADFDAALAQLRAVDGGGCTRVISLGFCMGGRFAFQTARGRFGLSGAIGLYGYPDELNGTGGPIQLAPELTAPILGMFAGDDEGIPAEMVARFDDALTAAGNDHEITTYPGTTHGFFESGDGRFERECADVWRRVMQFADKYGH